jgi:hypothetical protein
VNEVVAAAQRRALALAAGDVEALRALHHPALRWTTHLGEVLDRDAYLADKGSGWLAQRLADVHVAMEGDTAVLTAVVTDELVDGTFRMRLTQTWVRRDGGWVVLAGHAGPRY